MMRIFNQSFTDKKTLRGALASTIALFFFALCALCAPCHSTVIKNLDATDDVSRMFSQASLVANVEITSVRAQQAEAMNLKEKRRTDTRRAMLAEGRVVEIFKGAVAADSVIIEFFESEMREIPPLVSFRPGERRIVFLRHAAAPGSFMLLSPSSGSEAATEALMRRLRADASEDGAKQGKVSAVLDAGKDAKFAPGKASATLTIRNDSAGAFSVFENIEGAVELSVRKQEGGELAPKSDRSAPAPGEPFLLAPGHFIGVKLALSEMYDLSEPGVYTVAARIALPAPSGGGAPPALTAEPVSFAVTGEKP